RSFALLILLSLTACGVAVDDAPGEVRGDEQSLSCGGPGACWADLRSVNIGASFAPGRTGQWWCDHFFGANVEGTWECVEGTGSSCSSPVPNSGNVRCGRLGSDGSTPYAGASRVIQPLGYGRVERILVTQSAPGRTGQWWCDQHFGTNFGGSWRCRDVSGGGSCGATVPNGELVSCSQYADVQSVNVGGNAGPGRTGQWWCDVHFGGNLGGTWDCLAATGGSCTADASPSSTVTCGRYTQVDEAPFAPPSCTDPSLDGAERAFCSHTEYMTTRRTSTLYLYNDYLRAGINRSFGGALFELYGSDKRNRIEEHGGSAVQLSIWGYDTQASGTAYFTTSVCSPTAHGDADTCKRANGGTPCVAYAATGAHISNCTSEQSCGTWSAAGPWNPIQAQAANCGWNGPTNDVSQVTELNGALTFVKNDPYHFSKTTAFDGLTWRVTGKVTSNRPYLQLTYQMNYSSPRRVGEHNQEIPALFTDESLGHWYYYYAGNAPYADSRGAVTRLRSDFGTELRLPSRAAPLPQPPPSAYHDATEEWMTVCDREELQCLTVVSFAPGVKTFAQGGQYITPLGRFALGGAYNASWDIYLFPYRYDDVVAGRSVRDWIYDLKLGR
ncbi:MAG: hypothetical protein ABW123_19970, partial [Cystobacter sp.]